VIVVFSPLLADLGGGGRGAIVPRRHQTGQAFGLCDFMSQS
jgi:hypothetical protein